MRMYDLKSFWNTPKSKISKVYIFLAVYLKFNVVWTLVTCSKCHKQRHQKYYREHGSSWCEKNKKWKSRMNQLTQLTADNFSNYETNVWNGLLYVATVMFFFSAGVQFFLNLMIDVISVWLTFQSDFNYKH